MLTTGKTENRDIQILFKSRGVRPRNLGKTTELIRLFQGRFFSRCQVRKIKLQVRGERRTDIDFLIPDPCPKKFRISYPHPEVGNRCFISSVAPAICKIY